MKFSGVIAIDKSDVYAKVQGQKSKVQDQGHRGQNQFSRFRTITIKFEFTYGD